jgi:queuine/archaeosine tRNA-ribosyltransferase
MILNFWKFEGDTMKRKVNIELDESEISIILISLLYFIEKTNLRDVSKIKDLIKKINDYKNILIDMGGYE